MSFSSWYCGRLECKRNLDFDLYYLWLIHSAIQICHISLSIFVVRIIKLHEIDNFLELYNTHTTNKFNEGQTKSLRSKMSVLTILIIYILDRYYGANTSLASFIVVICGRILLWFINSKINIKFNNYKWWTVYTIYTIYYYIYVPQTKNSKIDRLKLHLKKKQNYIKQYFLD